MRKILLKRIKTLLISSILVLTFSIPVYANVNSTIPTSAGKEVNIAIINEDGSIESVTRSSIEGYAHVTLTNSNSGLIIYPTGSGIGGMGITINAYSSSDAWCELVIQGNDGSNPLNTLSQQNRLICLNRRGQERHNLITTNPAYYYIALKGIPSGVSVDFEIWLYG